MEQKWICLKHIVLMIVSVGGAIAVKLLGGMDRVLTALIFVMVIDYITGCILALIFKNSPKTDTGAYDSKAGFVGIVRKAVILICVMACTQLDIVLGLDGTIRSVVILFFTANDFLSIIENTGLMGVPWPKSVQNMLEVLRENLDHTNLNDDSK